MNAGRDRHDDLLDHIESATARLKALVGKFFGQHNPEMHAAAQEATAEVDRVAAAVSELKGDVPMVEAEAKADAEHLATEAVEVEAPVAKEAATDALHLAGEVKTDVTTAVKGAE